MRRTTGLNLRGTRWRKRGPMVRPAESGDKRGCGVAGSYAAAHPLHLLDGVANQPNGGGAVMFVIDGRKRGRESNFDALSTAQVIEMHERHFGRLDARTKDRIIADARLR